jgi:hypothetical protein
MIKLFWLTYFIIWLQTCLYFAKLIVPYLVFPQISMILFIGIPILFSISNIFFDKTFRRNINEIQNKIIGKN